MGIIRNLGSGGSKWQSCKYDVNVEIHFENGTVRALKKAQIAGFFIEKDFDKDHLPILLLDLALSRIDENSITNKTEFHIRVKKFYLETEGGEKKNQEMYLNDTFVKLDFGETPDNTTKIDKEIRSLNMMKDGDVAPEDLLSQKTYPLIKKDDLILTKKVINGVLANVSQLDIITWSLSKAGCRKKILLSNIMNATKVEEKLILPKGLLVNLLETEKEYGWHREGTCIFIDYNMFYIIRMNGQCTAWQQGEPKNVVFCISEATSDENIPSGVLVQRDKIYMNIGLDQYKMMSATDISDQIEGNNMILVDTGNGNANNVSGGVTSYGNSAGAYNTKSYHGHNEYVSEQYKRRKMEQKNQLKITASNCDIGFLTPNKQFSILTDVTSIVNRFSGCYRIASFKSAFVKNGDYFDSTTDITIKQVSN